MTAGHVTACHATALESAAILGAMEASRGPGETAARAVLHGGGEMGALMRTIDWSKTAVGPVEQWPQSLRTALSILLDTGFAMYIAWGPEFTQFYNDGYRPILGSTKHPSAMGIGTRETFREIWHIIGPMFEGVMRGTPVTVRDFLLPLDRHGFVEECYFDFSYSPIREETGVVGGVLVTVSETTGRVLAARRLETLRALGVRTKGAGTAREACEVAAEVLGENAADTPFVLLYLRDDDRLALAGSAGVPETLDPATLEALARAPEPRTVEVAPGTRARVLPIHMPGEARESGVLVAALSPRLALDQDYASYLDLVARQVGAAIASARALEEAQGRATALAEIDRAKTAFFSNVSHEFRTPLTLMLAPLEDALASPDGGLARPAVEMVHRNGLRLHKLVNTLLDFARIEAGRVEASYRPTDLASLTADLASAFRAAIERAGLVFDVRCDPLPEPILVDHDMWEKIVLNLLSNALKFTLRGEISVRLAWEDGAARLRIRDTGAGIPAAELPRLFERFHRIEGVPSRTHEGSGIGLALVQELVRLHGGSIVAESTPDMGTTFTVTIPAGHRHLPADRIAAAVPAGTSSAASAPFVEEALRWVWSAEESTPTSGEPSDARVLVVDDNADMRDYLRRVLGKRWHVDAAPDGRAALLAVEAHLPDVIVTDVMMPNLDGFGLLHALRATDRTRRVPVIMLSARAGEEASVEGLEQGADDYLAKPFAARELVARVDAQLLRARLGREAEAANRAKDEFLAILGHELRNPLAPIQTALELMKLRAGSCQHDRERAVIERQIRHLGRLVDDLLDVSRLTRGKVELTRERVEIAAVVEKAVEMASPLIEQRRHALRVDVLPGLVVRADPTRLAQVFSNLLMNAAKYTEPGGSIVVTGHVDDDDVVVEVADSGVGIEPETLKRIFQPFEQEHQTLDRALGGLGLGLAIVENLVKLHGGSATAHSAGRGRGSRFTVRLPLVRVEAVTPARPMRAASRASSTPVGRILVVDDNCDAADLLSELLQLRGYEVAVAYDGPSALHASVPDVALIDIGLPVMNGYELATQLRKRPELRATKLVAVTGYGQESDRTRSRSAGFDEHLVKPLDVDALAELLGRLIQQGQKKSATTTPSA